MATYLVFASQAESHTIAYWIDCYFLLLAICSYMQLLTIINEFDYLKQWDLKTSFKVSLSKLLPGTVKHVKLSYLHNVFPAHLWLWSWRGGRPNDGAAGSADLIAGEGLRAKQAGMAPKNWGPDGHLCYMMLHVYHGKRPKISNSY